MVYPQPTCAVLRREQAGRGSCRTDLPQSEFRIVNCAEPADIHVLADQQRLALIVLELVPSETADLDAIRSIRSHPRTGTVPILLTGRQLQRPVVVRAIEAGADDYLEAPFTHEQFRTRADLVIRARRKRLTNHMIRARLEKQVEAITVLHRFYEDILANDTVETTCRRSVETAARLVDSNRVSMLLADSRTCSLRFAHAVGMEESLWQSRQVPLSSPIAGRVLATRREIVVNRSTAWPRQNRYHSDQFISMPLICADLSGDACALGVLNVTERRSGQDFEPQEIGALRQLVRAAAFAIDAIRTREKLDATRDSIIFSLAKLSEYRHASTGKHLERVRELSLVLARQLASDPRVTEPISNRFLGDLGRAAPLHDVGKVGIPDRILLKDGRLTPEEFAVIRDHTVVGAATLQSVMSAGHDDSFLQMAMEIAHCHHERYDGTGYPQGLAGQAIPLSARIVCLADSYDAIRTAREYKPARSHTEATRELLLASGSQFDPIVVQAFCAVEDQFERIYNNLMEYAGRREHTQDGPISSGGLTGNWQWDKMLV